jgi:hypothetical protein
MLGKTQTQKSVDNAVAVQAGRDVVLHVGVTADEVRALASDTFKADFVKMLGMAEAIAEARANKVLDAFIERIERANPSALQYANDPDFRYSLYTAQKTAARSGDANLQDLLVELLVERACEAPRSLLQLVLNESIEVIQKISNAQINALTLAFVLRHLTFDAASFDTLIKTMDVYVQPFLGEVAGSYASLSHLEYAGCGTLDDRALRTATEALVGTYPGAFQYGVSEADACVKGLSSSARSLLIPCEHNPGHVQVLGTTREMVRRLCKERRLGMDDTAMLNRIFAGDAPVNVREVCVEARPYLTKLFDKWDGSTLPQFCLTSIGIAIAHANLSKYGLVAPLSSWIN